MTLTTHTILSMHQGAVWAAVAVCVFDAWVNQSRPSRGAAAYIALSACVAGGISGWADTVWVPAGNATAIWPSWAILVPLTCVWGVLGARDLLTTKWRNPAHDKLLLWAAWAGACTLSLGCAAWLRESLLPSGGTQEAAYLLTKVAVSAAAVVALAGLALEAWVSWQLVKQGDRLARWMACAGLFTFLGFALIGLARALDITLPAAVLAVAAVLHIAGSGCIAFVAIQRGKRQAQRGRALGFATQTDELAHLPTGSNLARAMREMAESAGTHVPAVVIVNVFNLAQIGAAHGAPAINQVLSATLARLQGVVPSSDLLGHLGRASFVIMPKLGFQPHDLRALSLALAAAVSRELALRGPTAQATAGVRVRVEAAVGVCWSQQISDMQQALHQARLACEEARHVACLAAIRTYPNRPAVAADWLLPTAEQSVPLGSHSSAA